MNTPERPRETGIFNFARKGATAPISDPSSEIGSIPGEAMPRKSDNAANDRAKVVGRTMQMLKKHPLAFAEALLAIGGGAYGVTQGISLINGEDNSSSLPATRDVGSVPGGTSSDQYNQQVVPAEQQKPKLEVFDNEAKSGVITPRMKKIVPKEELQKLDSFARLANQKTTITTARELIEVIPPEERKIYPGPVNLDTKFEIGEDKNTIEIVYPLDLSQTSKEDAETKYVKSFSAASIGGDLGEDLFKDKGYSDKIEFRMKDGSRIPKGTVLNMFLLNEDGGYLLQGMVGEDKKDALIDIQSPNGNIYRFLVIASKGEGRNTKIVSLEPLVPAPKFNPEFNIMPVGTYGYNVVGGQPILELSEDADRVEIVLLGSHKGTVGETSRSRPGLSPFVVTNFKMFVDEGKLLISEWSSNILDMTKRSLSSGQNFVSSSFATTTDGFSRLTKFKVKNK